MPTIGLEDEFGFVPTYTLAGRTLTIADLPAALDQADSLTIDHAAINIFLRTEFYLGGTTPFRELRRVVPPPTIVPPAEISRTDAIDRFIALFREAVRRRVTADNMVALSGGRDSRHILLELHRQGAPVRAVSVDLEMNEDGRVARALAARAGVPHKLVPPSRSIDDARHTVWATGLMSLEHAWAAELSRARGAAAWWDGIAGDVMAAGLFLTESNLALFQRGRLEELADQIVKPGRVPYFRDQHYFHREAAVAAVHDELLRHVDAANPIGSFYFWNRTRTNVGTSPFGLLSAPGRVMRAPFLDRDLWPFLASVPVRHVLDHQFHTETIHRAFPAFADIPLAGRHPTPATTQRRNALRLVRAIATREPSAVNLKTVMQLVRSIVEPSHAADVGWILPTWVYGDVVTSLARRRR
jgi:hypothetical protein